MIDKPTTRKQAEEKQYGYSFAPQQFNPRRCAEEISSGIRGTTPHQCKHTPGHGPEELYCKAHSLQFEKAKLRWWRLDSCDDLTPHDIVKITDKKVFRAGGSSEEMRGKWANWFPSQEAAIRFLIYRETNDIKRSEANLLECNQRLIKWKKMLADCDTAAETLPATKSPKEE